MSSSEARRLPFSGFLPFDLSSPAVGDILRSGRRAVFAGEAREIQWCQVRLSRGLGYWASTSNPSVAKDVIEVETYDLMTRTQVAAGVIHDMLEKFPRVRHDIIRRYTKSIEVGGCHIEHLL